MSVRGSGRGMAAAVEAELEAFRRPVDAAAVRARAQELLLGPLAALGLSVALAEELAALELRLGRLERAMAVLAAHDAAR